MEKIGRTLEIIYLLNKFKYENTRFLRGGLLRPQISLIK